MKKWTALTSRYIFFTKTSDTKQDDAYQECGEGYNPDLSGEPHQPVLDSEYDTFDLYVSNFPYGTHWVRSFKKRMSLYLTIT